MSFETISIIGLGYIGLPTAAAFASRKKKVIGVDINQVAVDTINAGNIHIFEPDLDIVVRAAVTGGYLRATTVPEPADAFMIAVPTPFTANHAPDLSYVESAARAIAPVLRKGDLIILESTSPVGTTEHLAALIAKERPDLQFPGHGSNTPDINMAYCPERVLPGQVMRELVENDRVIGGLTPECSLRATELYKVFVQGEKILTNARTAELCKLTENAFRDVNIAFANELSLICDKLRINVWELIRLANRHPRVNILQPGPGVGGHCIAVDPWFIIDSAPEEAKLIQTARNVNDYKPHYVVQRVKDRAARFVSPTIACLGLSFKANIDDLRESPSVEIVKELTAARVGRILAVEPHVKQLPRALANLDVSLVSLEKGLEEADIVLGLVDHSIFKAMDLALLDDKVVIDTRGMWR